MYQFGGRDDVVGTGTRLLFRLSGGQIPAGVSGFSALPNAQTEFDSHTNCYAIGNGTLCQESSDEDLLFNPSPPFSTKVKNGGPMFLPTLYAIMLWTGKIISFTKTSIFVKDKIFPVHSIIAI